MRTDSIRFSFYSLFPALLVGLFLTLNLTLSAQCAPGEKQILVEILTDNYPAETTWNLTDAVGTVLLSGGPYAATGTLYSDSICILDTGAPLCLQLTVIDSYGDGLCCAYGSGSYTAYINGVVAVTGGVFGSQDVVQFDCAPGTSCSDAVLLTDADLGIINQTSDNFWYTYTPLNTGMYDFNSCGSGCNTTVFIYEYCNMNAFDNTNIGTIYYDDAQGGCGQEANVTALLSGGVPVWIRFASLDASCGVFNWTFNYAGPPTGCTDPTACNFSPDAVIDDGSCIFPGDPLCTGPDLTIVTSAITSSLYATTINVNQTDCYIEEGCLNGFGQREIIRFTTHIKNIGDLDYYIGSTSQNAQTLQFEWANCHNHWHYAGYAKYDLFDANGGNIPIGFKNGFCVMDLECSGGGTATYGCSNMGITAGCGDIYSSGLSCQWIDVTDVPDGQYQLVVRVNWDYSPDALGRYETNTNNNWGVVCINIHRTNGYAVDIITNCPVYTDCAGDAYGLAQLDCTGTCGGATLIGDIDNDFDQDFTDAQLYVSGVLGNDIIPTPCTDINQDGQINVTDAAIMADCQYWNVAHTHIDSSGFHTHCDFPVPAITNPFDNVTFTIGNVNWGQQYFDVHVLNPDNRISAYQLQFDGIQISQTESLVPLVDYTGAPSHVPGGIDVVTLSYDGTSIPKHIVYSPLLRVHWIGSANGMVCISQVIDVVNDALQNTITGLFDACAQQTVSACPSDVDGDLVVTVNDILIVLSEFGCLTGCVNDVNGDGTVNVNDVLLVLSAFGTVC